MGRNGRQTGACGGFALKREEGMAMETQHLKQHGYEVEPSRSQPGRFRWWRNTGSDGVSVPARELSETTFGSEGEAWVGAARDAEIIGLVGATAPE